MLSYEEFKKQYEDYAFECRCALRITEARLINIKETLDHYGLKNPFNRIESRIKTLESAWVKYQKKYQEKASEGVSDNVRDFLHDVAGIRVITMFRDEIYDVVEAIRLAPGINIIEEKDYVKNPKESGYMSYHIDSMTEIFSTTSKLVRVEIQVRDKSMNLWASHEHLVRYKNDSPSPEAQKLYQQMANSLREYDDIAMKLRDFQAPVKEWPISHNNTEANPTETPANSTP